MSAESDYSRLLPIRDEVFPTFDTDQQVAASAIASIIAPHIEKHGITAIVDLGCGTGEVLKGVRERIVAPTGRQIRSIGIDCCAAEISIARRSCAGCEFVVQGAEEYVRHLARDEAGIDPARTLVMCVGHSIPHFDQIDEFLDDLARWRPARILMDFHEGWDTIVRHFDGPNAGPVQQAKQSLRSSDGRTVAYVLTTKRNPADPERVLRGIEAIGNGATAASFWTTQCRRSSDWFLAEMGRRGYVLGHNMAYKGGYGPMNALLLSRR